MTEIRCKKCKRLLIIAKRVDGEIKCPKCGFINGVLYPIPKPLENFPVGVSGKLENDEYVIS